MNKESKTCSFGHEYWGELCDTCYPDTATTAPQSGMTQEQKQAYKDWFFSKDRVYFPTPDEQIKWFEENIPAPQSADQNFRDFMTIIHANQGIAKSSDGSEWKGYNCKAAVLETYEDLIAIADKFPIIRDEAVPQGDADGWLIDDMPKDGTPILRWHKMWKCPIAVRYIPGKFDHPWIEKTLTTSWPEESFTEHWQPLPAAPKTK